MLLVMVGAQYITTAPNYVYEEEESIPYLEYQPVANIRQLELLEQKEIRLGYIATGQVEVDRIAVQISGAMTLAVKDINENPDILPEYNVSFYFGNTTGEEKDSLLKMAQLHREGVLAFFGPDLTCDIEARFAAAVNLPIISYVSIIFAFLSKLQNVLQYICQFVDSITIYSVIDISCKFE